MLVRQCVEDHPEMEIQYKRGVREQGNQKAREMMNQVFETADGNWRGIGEVPGSGLVYVKFTPSTIHSGSSISPYPIRRSRQAVYAAVF